MPSKTVDKWLSQYKKGDRARVELLSLLFSHLTVYPEEVQT